MRSSTSVFSTSASAQSSSASQGFCRRHVAELLPTDRRETGGMLGSSMLLSAVIDRRTTDLDAAIGSRGRGLRARLKRARERPPCIACSQGATAVETALVRLSERAGDAAWGAALTVAPLCLDDFLALWATAGSDPGFEPVARAQVARFTDLRRRLDGFAQHSSHDRYHLLTEEERSAADEASQVLGGDGAGSGTVQRRSAGRAWTSDPSAPEVVSTIPRRGIRSSQPCLPGAQPAEAPAEPASRPFAAPGCHGVPSMGRR